MAMINHEVRFCGTVIWPRSEVLDQVAGVIVTERDVIAAWPLVESWVKQGGTGRPPGPSPVIDLRRAHERASSWRGLLRVMDHCHEAYNKPDADRSDTTPPDPST